VFRDVRGCFWPAELGILIAFEKVRIRRNLTIIPTDRGDGLDVVVNAAEPFPAPLKA